MTPIYHITHLHNLPSIITAGGLHCDNDRGSLPTECVGIAHEHIKQRRANRRVPTCSGGKLADYVPFYFAPRSPMLYAIIRGEVEGYAQGQQPILHLVSSAEAVEEAGKPFTWTEGHADMAFSEFFEGLTDLSDKIDWEVMQGKFWNDDPPAIVDRKRKRQAEFLVYRFFPWTLFSTIGVIDEATRTEVLRLTAGAAHQPDVRVQRNWYY